MKVRIFFFFLNYLLFKTCDLSIASTKTKQIKIKNKTQNIFCCLDENLTTFLYTLTLCHLDKKTKCIPKLNVIKKKLGLS